MEGLGCGSHGWEGKSVIPNGDRDRSEIEIVFVVMAYLKFLYCYQIKEVW